MDAGLVAFVLLKGGLVLLFYVMWRQAARAADEARKLEAVRVEKGEPPVEIEPQR